MTSGLLKRIHVNQHNIRANKKNNNTELPVFTVKTYKENLIANAVSIDGPSVMVYRPGDPLSCGAHCWLETRAPVQVHNNDGSTKEV
jgi:hypothetical protein